MKRSKASVKWLRKIARKYHITLVGDARKPSVKNKWAEQIAEYFLDLLVQTYDKVKAAVNQMVDCPVYMGDYQLFMPVKLYWKHNHKFCAEISTDMFNNIYYRYSGQSRNSQVFVDCTEDALQAVTF